MCVGGRESFHNNMLFTSYELIHPNIISCCWLMSENEWTFSKNSTSTTENKLFINYSRDSWLILLKCRNVNAWHSVNWLLFNKSVSNFANPSKAFWTILFIRFFCRLYILLEYCFIDEVCTWLPHIFT